MGFLPDGQWIAVIADSEEGRGRLSAELSACGFRPWAYAHVGERRRQGLDSDFHGEAIILDCVGLQPQQIHARVASLRTAHPDVPLLLIESRTIPADLGLPVIAKPIGNEQARLIVDAIAAYQSKSRPPVDG
jgi:hypothetical protein